MNVRESFWLIPAVAMLVAVVLGVALVELDMLLTLELAESWPRLFGAGPEGARGMLSAIAGSMITVAGVVFSITIVALSLAASTYSPRVLRTFMRDRPTQATFGVLVGIFVYCLVVLRTIRGDADGEEFVPALAVLFALLLALVGVGFLIHFIHHVALVIQAPTILQRIADDTGLAVDHLFPEKLGEGDGDPEEERLPETLRHWRPVPALGTGYIAGIDNERLLDFACRRRVVLRMELGVGEFAIESQPLVSLADETGAEGDDNEEVAAHDARELNEAFSFATERTIDQDAAFGVQQIVSVAVRALSPGINDPSTAMMCIDRVAAVLVRVAGRSIPSRLRKRDGKLRVIAKGASFESLAAQAFEPLLSYAEGKDEVLRSLLRAACIVAHAASPHRKLVMRRHIEAIERALKA